MPAPQKKRSASPSRQSPKNSPNATGKKPSESPTQTSPKKDAVTKPVHIGPAAMGNNFALVVCVAGVYVCYLWYGLVQEKLCVLPSHTDFLPTPVRHAVPEVDWTHACGMAPRTRMAKRATRASDPTAVAFRMKR